jgi:transcriptional regulator with XRE-family HTH domain
MRSVYTELYRAMLARLRSARKAAGMTQTDVAKALRRPQSFVSNCESGERRVDVVELLEFARLYKKPLSYFVSAR